MARWARIGADRLPDLAYSHAKTQPAAPVTNTVTGTGCPVERASGTCDSPNVAAVTNRPPVPPKARAATVPSAAR